MIYNCKSKRAIRFQNVDYANVYEYKIARHNMCVRGELYSDYSETEFGSEFSDEEGSGTDSSDEQRRKAGWRANLNYR